MKQSRVVHLIDGLTLGGAEMMLYKVISRQQGGSVRHSVISFMEGGELFPRIQATGVRVQSLGLKRGIVSFSAFLQLLRLVRAESPDIIMTWCATANLVGTIAALFSGSPRVLWYIQRSALRPDECSRITFLATRFCARLSRFMDLVVANAEAARRGHESMGYHPKKWIIIPNGFDLEEFKPDPEARTEMRSALGISSEVPLIGIVGRSNPIKDHATFVRAAALLHASMPDVHFIMVGAGLTSDSDTLRNIAPQLISSGRLHLFGARSDIPRLLSAIDIFTLTSLGEGFPNVVGEAMACGVPCVVTETSGDSPAIVGETGRVVPASDPTALCSSWEDMLSLGVQERRQLGQAARERIINNYGIETVVEQFTKLFLSISKDRR